MNKTNNMHNKSRKDKKEITQIKNKVIRDYKEALDGLVKFKKDALKQIEDNPFLRRKWSWIDCIMAGVPMSRMPKTPYQEMIDLMNKRFSENMEQLKLNVMAKVEAIYE